MTHKRSVRSQQGRRRAIAGIVIAAVTALSMVLASTALATTHHPTGEYASFADCPLSNASVETCLYATTESGEFIVGTEDVPIVSPIVLQGGTRELSGGKEEFIAAEDGNTLSKTPQKVPGGLLGLIKCNEIKGEGLIEKGERAACELVFENKTTGVNATTELAEPASKIGISIEHLIEGSGTALSLPVKVHLENSLLGSSCYIGSNSNPIILNLTTGTTSPPAPNKPIKGKTGSLEFKEGGNLIVVKNNSLVNNSYGAPGASGCGGFLVEYLLDPIINSKLGLPSAEGKNTAILNGTLKAAAAAAVKASE